MCPRHRFRAGRILVTRKAWALRMIAKIASLGNAPVQTYSSLIHALRPKLARWGERSSVMNSKATLFFPRSQSFFLTTMRVRQKIYIDWRRHAAFGTCIGDRQMLAYLTARHG
jgi:hypothetical protein